VLCARKSFAIIKVFAIIGEAGERTLSLVRVCLPVLVVGGRRPGLPLITGARHDGGTRGRQHSDRRRERTYPRAL
jgi:hypothetical protein